MKKAVVFTEENFKLRVQKCIDIIFDEEGVKQSNIPIYISDMGTTNGYFKYVYGQCHSLTFSNSLLTGGYSLYDVDQIIMHEVIHYLLCSKGKLKAGHGKIFKDYCAKHGCVRDKSYSKMEIVDADKVLATYKYALECQQCGIIHGNSRMTKSVKYPHAYRCKCGGTLERVK